jgi:hypothetical protein
MPQNALSSINLIFFASPDLPQFLKTRAPVRGELKDLHSEIAHSDDALMNG